MCSKRPYANCNHCDYAGPSEETLCSMLDLKEHAVTFDFISTSIDHEPLSWSRRDLLEGNRSL